MTGDITIHGLLKQAIVFLFINSAITIVLNKRVITASTAFWFGWIFLLTGTISFINNDLMSNYGNIEIYYISLFHKAALIGFSIGNIIAVIISSNKKVVKSLENTPLFDYSRFISDSLTDKFLIIIFFIGVVFFTQRLSVVGFGLDYFTNAREVYLEREFNIFNWIGTHLSVIVYCLIIVQGIKDSFGTMNLKRLLKVIIYCSPLFLANSTRTFLILPLINYFSSFLLMRALLFRGIKIIKIKELVFFTTVLIGLLTIFSVIGFLRGGYGSDFNAYRLVVGWPISTSYALDSWINAALNCPSTNGLMTFDWFVNFFDRIGLLDFSYEKNIIKNINKGFILSNNSASVIPRSMIPDIIFDFGKTGFFAATILITLFSQIITIIFVGKGIFKHGIATLFFIGMFMTIQDSIFSPVFVTTTFWLLVLNVYAKKNVDDSEAL